MTTYKSNFSKCRCLYLEGRWWWFCCHRNQWGDDGLRERSAQSGCHCRGGDRSGRCVLLWCHTTCSCCPPVRWPAGGRWGPQPLKQLHFLRGTGKRCFNTTEECRLCSSTFILLLLFIAVASWDLTHRIRGELCPPPEHSWAPAGPKSGPFCPASPRQSSSLPTYTKSECDLFKQNSYNVPHYNSYVM